MTKPQSYTAKDIEQLPYPLNVQKRPNMYIGNPDSSGKLTCFREILNNSVDEFLSNNASIITVTRLSEDEFAIADNGRGVPFDKHKSGKNALEVIFGELHAGRNFSEKTVYSTGINGVGASCVNALSEIFQVTSQRSHDIACITFNDGIKTNLELKKDNSKLAKNKTGTIVHWRFNNKFFEENSVIDEKDLKQLLEETALLNDGLKINFINYFNEDESNETQFTSSSKFGIGELLINYSPAEKNNKKYLFQPVSFKADTINNTKIEVAFTYSESDNNDVIHSFCNTIKTSEGGTHVTGFKRAMSQNILAFIKENNLSKEKIESDDIFNGLNAIVSVFVFNPKYTNQVKSKLANNEVNGHVFSYTNRAINEWLNDNPNTVKLLVKKIELSAKARIAQKRALEAVKKDTNNSLMSLTNIDKFSDCEENSSGRTELFCVEG